MSENTDEWENEQIERLTRLYPQGIGRYMRRDHTISSDGHRIVYCVENARGIRKYFNQSEDALALVRESKFKPCRIEQIPVLPQYEYWQTPIKELATLIEDAIRKG